MPGGRTNCSPNSHRKCRRNVPRIFDVCWELKSDCKSYFGFLVDKFSEAVNTEINAFSIIAWSDCWSWSQVKKNADSFSFSVKKKKCLIAGYQNWEFLYYWFRIIWTIALHFSHQIPPIRFDETFCGHSMNSTVGHLSFWDFFVAFVASSRIKGKPCKF